MENGKPITQSFAEVKKSAAHCRYYAENLERFLKPDRIKTDANKSLVFYEPLGKGEVWGVVRDRSFCLKGQSIR